MRSLLQGPQPDATNESETSAAQSVPTSGAFPASPSQLPAGPISNRRTSSRPEHVAFGNRRRHIASCNICRCRSSRRRHLSGGRPLQRDGWPAGVQRMPCVQQPREQDGRLRARAGAGRYESDWIRRRGERQGWGRCGRAQCHSGVPKLRDNDHAAVEEGRAGPYDMQRLWYAAFSPMEFSRDYIVAFFFFFFFNSIVHV